MPLRIRHVGRIRRLMIRSANWIGDAVMTTPAICDIRRHFPKARITLLAKPWVSPVFEGSAHVDEIMIYDATGRHRGINGFMNLIADLRKYRFEAAILFQNAFEAALIPFLARIPQRIGYPTDGRGLLLTHRVPIPLNFNTMHQVAYYKGILEGIGIKASSKELHVQVKRSDALRAEDLLKRCGADPQERIVGINFGAAYGPAKQWPIERFADLADRIHDHFGCRIVLFGAPRDRAAGGDLEKRMKSPAVNIAGKTDLGEAIALIRRCDLFITNDSGLMHVAAALKVPLIAIFGSTNPWVTGPWNCKVKLMRYPISCSPCLEPACPEGHLKCMTRIEVEAVYEAVKELL